MQSPKQIQNLIKVVVVAALAKEFRKSQIIKRILENVKKNDQIASGSLSRPDVTGSITPSADDRWLIKPDAVLVKVITKNKKVVGATVKLNIRYGIEPQYFWLSNKSPNEKWWPDGYKIEEWIKMKAAKGKRFTIKRRGDERTMNPSNASEVASVAYLISRSISRKGIKKTNLTDPFYGEDGVYKSVSRAKRRYTARIYELFLSIITTEQELIFTNITK